MERTYPEEVQDGDEEQRQQRFPDSELRRLGLLVPGLEAGPVGHELLEKCAHGDIEENDEVADSGRREGVRAFNTQMPHCKARLPGSRPCRRDGWRGSSVRKTKPTLALAWQRRQAFSQGIPLEGSQDRQALAYRSPHCRPGTHVSRSRIRSSSRSVARDLASQCMFPGRRADQTSSKLRPLAEATHAETFGARGVQAPGGARGVKPHGGIGGIHAPRLHLGPARSAGDEPRRMAACKERWLGRTGGGEPCLFSASSFFVEAKRRQWTQLTRRYDSRRRTFEPSIQGWSDVM